MKNNFDNKLLELKAMHDFKGDIYSEKDFVEEKRKILESIVKDPTFSKLEILKATSLLDMGVLNKKDLENLIQQSVTHIKLK